MSARDKEHPFNQDDKETNNHGKDYCNEDTAHLQHTMTASEGTQVQQGDKIAIEAYYVPPFPPELTRQSISSPGAFTESGRRASEMQDDDTVEDNSCEDGVSGSPSPLVSAVLVYDYDVEETAGDRPVLAQAQVVRSRNRHLITIAITIAAAAFITGISLAIRNRRSGPADSDILPSNDFVLGENFVNAKNITDDPLAYHAVMWGSVTNCAKEWTPIEVSCPKFVQIESTLNATCDRTSDQLITCEPKNGDAAFVLFSCSDDTESQVQGTARIPEAETFLCNNLLEQENGNGTYGGYAFWYLSLGRFCQSMNDSSWSLYGDFSCNGGARVPVIPTSVSRGQDQSIQQQQGDALYQSFCMDNGRCNTTQNCLPGETCGQDTSCDIDHEAVQVTAQLGQTPICIASSGNYPKMSTLWAVVAAQWVSPKDIWDEIETMVDGVRQR